jgi:hypothetical protein
MLKSFALTVALGAGAAPACTGFTYHLKSEELEPGVYRVLRGSGSFALPGAPQEYETIGIARLSDFKTYLEVIISNHSLVFIGAIDSVIGNGMQDPVVPGLVPHFTLAPLMSVGVYARIQVDTILKGTLPANPFWILANPVRSSCHGNFHKTGKFLNFSNKLDSLSDLKVSTLANFCANCPTAHWFDGRYLRSPEFPVLALDITQLYPDYPATSVHRRSVPVIPLRLDGKAYRPDGRTVPAAKAGRKTALPLLR